MNGIDETQRTKSFGQLYEQIWANNNTNNNTNNNANLNANSNHLIQNQRAHPANQHQHSQPHFHAQHSLQQPSQVHFAASVDDLNLKNLEITNGHFSQHHFHANGPMATHALSEKNLNANQQLRKYDFIDTSAPQIPSKVSRSNLPNGHNGQRAIPIELQFESSAKGRNYENQVLNSAAATQQVKPPPPPVLAKPTVPSKPFNIHVNGGSASTNNLALNAFANGTSHANSSSSLNSKVSFFLKTILEVGGGNLLRVTIRLDF